MAQIVIQQQKVGLVIKKE